MRQRLIQLKPFEMSKKILELIDIEKTFTSSNSQSLQILRGVRLVLESGEMVGLFSPSGAGKTTLLQIAGLLDAPSSGVVKIVGRETAKLSDSEKTFLRNQWIGFVYQFHHLLPEFSALENVSIPQWCSGTPKLKAEKAALELLTQVGLEDRAYHRPSELSGGEQQRVALCRALVNNPKILLADEPTGNLDPDSSNLVFDILINLVKERDLGALVVTHNLNLARRMDRVVTIEDKCLKNMKL